MFSNYRLNRFHDNSIFESIFLLIFSVLIFMSVLSSSQITNMPTWGRFNTITLGLCGAVMLIAFLFYGQMDTRSFAVGIIMAMMCVIIRQQSDRGREIIFFIMLAWLGTFINQRRAIKRYIIVASFTIILILILYYTGFFYNESIGRNDAIVERLYLGFLYTTTAPQFLFHITIAYFFIKKKPVNLIETIVILACNIALYIMTDTNTVFYELFALLGVMWLIRIFPRFFRYRIFKIIATWTMPVLALLMLGLLYIYNPANVFLARINTLTSGRLSVGKNALNAYGIHPFGTKTEWVTTIASREDNTYMNADSSYLNTALSFGIVILIFIIIAFMIISRRLHNSGEYMACAALVFLAIMAFTDTQLFEFRRNPMILLVGSAYIYRGKTFFTGDTFMNYINQTERSISVRTLAFRVLKRWYIILIVAACAGALASVYRMVSNNKSSNDATAIEAQTTYEEQLADYNRNKATYEDTISNIEENIQSKLDYMSNSVLLSIDPNREAFASTRLYFQSDEYADPASRSTDTDYTANQIIDAFSAYLTDTSLYEDLAKELDTEPLYALELIGNGKDYTISSLSLNAKHSDANKAKQMLEYVIDLVNEHSDDLIERFGEFTITKDDVIVKEVIDSNLQNLINSKANDIKTLETTLTYVKQAADKLEKPQAPANMNQSQSLKNALSFGAKIFALSLAAMIILTAIVIIARRRVLSSRELNDAYSLKEIAVFKGKSDTAKNIGKYDVAAENIAGYTKGASNILLTGGAPVSYIKTLVHELSARLKNVNFEYAPIVNANADSIEKLKEADSVIFVEKVGSSRYTDIDKNYSCACNWNKDIAGSIIF